MNRMHFFTPTPPHSNRLHTALRCAVGSVITALLAACGGGGGGSTSTGNTPPPSTTGSTLSSAGTVTGFGSVFVDGVELDDANARVTVENSDGSTTPVAIKLGQQVRVAHDSRGSASQVTVDAAVIGQISAVSASANTLQVAGQSISINTDGTSTAPITVYGGGYTALANALVGDMVEVHGTPVYNSVSQTYTVQATRLEKRTDKPGLRVMGKLSSLNSSATTFSLGNLSVNYASAIVVPSGAALAQGQSVVVWGASTALSGNNLKATRVRVFSQALADSVTSGTTQLAGLVSKYNATASTMEVQGVTVNLAKATISPSGKTVGNNSFVDIGGTIGSDGVLSATTVRVRQQDVTNTATKVLLIGAIESLTDQNSFVLRGVPVDAGSVGVRINCPSTLAVGSTASVVASTQAGTSVVLASKLECPLTSTSTNVMRSALGTASKVDTTTLTFTLTATNASTTQVKWTAQTAFTHGLTAATLASTTAKVKVRGYLDSNQVLVAREIYTEGKEDTDAYDADGDETTGSAWDDYRGKKGR